MGSRIVAPSDYDYDLRRVSGPDIHDPEAVTCAAVALPRMTGVARYSEQHARIVASSGPMRPPKVFK